jgi:type IV secretion system protein TrbB
VESRPPDGCLWIDRLTKGQADTGARLDANAGLRIVQVIADHVGVEVHARSPLLSAELPESGERFQGLIPPVVTAPTFSIRKPAAAVFTLEDYVRAGIMTAEQSAFLRNAVAERRNILVAGGTSTGKTTLANALLDMIAQTNDRVLLIEDTRELQCLTRNIVAMRTKDGIVSLFRSCSVIASDAAGPYHCGRGKGAQFRNDVTSWWRGHALDISRRSRRSSTQGCRPNPQPMERILAQNLLVRRDDRGPSCHYTA